jgi:hypothetical protein
MSSKQTQKCCFFCQESENVTPCTDCKSGVYYCSQLHLDVHKPKGLEQCLPIKMIIHEDETVGRILVASQDIKASELVILDKAFCMGPDLETVCLGCLRQIYQ